MITPTETHKVNLICKAHAVDKIRREKIALQPKQKMLSFRNFLKRRALQETFISDRISNGGLLGFIPMDATLDDKAETASEIAAQIVRLAEAGDVTITAIAVSPDAAQ